MLIADRNAVRVSPSRSNRNTISTSTSLPAAFTKLQLATDTPLSWRSPTPRPPTQQRSFHPPGWQIFRWLVCHADPRRKLSVARLQVRSPALTIAADPHRSLRHPTHAPPPKAAGEVQSAVEFEWASTRQEMARRCARQSATPLGKTHRPPSAGNRSLAGSSASPIAPNRAFSALV